MLVLVDTDDSHAVRNKDNALALYDLMINQKKSEEATAKVCASRVHPAQPSDPRRGRRPWAVFRSGHQGARTGSRGGA